MDAAAPAAALSVEVVTENSVTVAFDAQCHDDVTLLVSVCTERTLRCAVSGAGRVTFPFLAPDKQIRVRLLSASDLLGTAETATLSPLPEFQLPMEAYIGPEHPVGKWIHLCPSNIRFLWSTADLVRDDKFLLSLFQQGVFYLPGEIALLPHPVSRFCLRLSPDVNWRRSRRVRSAVKSGRYRFCCATDPLGVQRGVAFARRMKMEQGERGSTWLTTELIEAFMRQIALRDSPILHGVFQLWEGDELLAVCCGYGRGRCWHDYTAASVRRADRVGTLVSKMAGELLARCGYRLWYWGEQSEGTAYMSDFIPYGGHELQRTEFMRAWCGLCSETPNLLPPAAIDQGFGMVPPPVSKS